MLPIRILPGMLSIYGQASLNGLNVDGMQFGLVNQMYGDKTYSDYQLGDSVMFQLNSSIPINYNQTAYFLIQESDIKLIETPPL